jgi:hypothetical protein
VILGKIAVAPRIVYMPYIFHNISVQIFLRIGTSLCNPQFCSFEVIFCMLLDS